MMLIIVLGVFYIWYEMMLGLAALAAWVERVQGMTAKVGEAEVRDE